MPSFPLKRPEPFIFTQEKARNEEEAEDVFHFVSYIHFNNKVLELDGLRESPVLIAQGVDKSKWVEVAKESIIKRIEIYSTNEVKFNLMAVVPDVLMKKTAELKQTQQNLAVIRGKLGLSPPIESSLFEKATEEELKTELMIGEENEQTLLNDIKLEEDRKQRQIVSN